MITNAITRRFSRRGFLLMTSIGLGMTGPVGAQSFPSNVIRIVVPTPPGGPPDVISRVVANELSEREGWRVVVENRPGAMQTIGMADVLKQPADGYSLLAMSVPVMAAPALLPKMGLRPELDFAPVIKLATSYNVLVVTPSLPVKSVSELVRVLKNKPDGLNFSSGASERQLISLGKCSSFRPGCARDMFRRSKCSSA
jgi:tripartite-type tricarboxylate transporter receptor subunit TctC